MRNDSLTNTYPIRVRSSLIFVLFIITLLFYLMPRFSVAGTGGAEVADTPDIIIVPPITDFNYEKPEAPPKRPAIIVPDDDDNFEDPDLTIDNTDWDLDLSEWVNTPPLPSGDERFPFVIYSEPPHPLTPISPIYPPDAIRLGIGGKVTVVAFIDKFGYVKDADIKDSDNVILNDAAIQAVKNTKWEPARQRDKKVGVTVSIPIHFSLD